MKIFYLFMAMVMFAFAFWVHSQTFSGVTILFFLGIMGGLVGLVKGFLFSDAF